MMIDLDRVVNILREQRKKSCLFKSTSINKFLSNTPIVNSYYNTTSAKPITSSLFQKQLKSNLLPCNLPAIIKESTQVLYVSGLGVGFKKSLLEDLASAVMQAFCAKKVYCNRHLRFYRSVIYLIFPHRCKKIFVHFSEKTNLLLRSDNNTEFSAWKILQTTTI